MASMIPYSRYATPLANWFGLMDELANNNDAARGDIAPSSFMLDVQDNPEGYVVEATLPGVDREQIDVELNEGRLNITVDKQDSEEVVKRNYVHRETSAYHAVRSVYLKDADTAGLSAQLKDGILTVNVPKRTQNAHVTKIAIA